MKICSKCRVLKTDSEFTKNKRAADRLSYWCRACDSEKQREIYCRPEIRERRAAYLERTADNVKASSKKYRSEHPLDTLQKRAQHIKYNYGMTPKDRDDLIIRQGGKCAICEAHLLKPYIDHCHKTGKVRGLLCRNCNFAIGLLDDSPKKLHAAAAYLENSLDKKPEQAT